MSSTALSFTRVQPLSHGYSDKLDINPAFNNGIIDRSILRPAVDAVSYSEFTGVLDMLAATDDKLKII